MRRFALILMFAAGTAFGVQVAEDPREREMLSIASELRCAVCQNQSVADSDADLARDMRELIREQLAAGKRREEIIDYFVARYGEFVLMKPPYAGPGFLVWVGPVLLLALLALSAFFYLRRRQRVPLPPAPELSPEDAERVAAARRQAAE